MTELRTVGRRVPRVDAAAKAAGRSRYADDLVFPELLLARLVRSTIPHARVRSVDGSAAAERPGVELVVGTGTASTVLSRLRSFDPACHDFEREPPFAPEPGDFRLFDTTVRYVGEPVAMVVARSDRAALDARRFVTIDYEELPAATSIDAAVAPGAALIHDDAAGNIADSVVTRLGDADAALASAAHVVTKRFTTPRQKQAQLEPTTCVAVPEPDGAFTVWSPTQAPHRARATLARWFGMPEIDIRVVNPEIGGAFGKNDALTAEPYALVAAAVTGRPVKLRFSRDEDFVGTEARHPSRIDIEIGVDADGRITGLRVRAVVDAGAYRSHTPRVLRVISSQFLATYAIEHADVEVAAVFTNTPVAGAFRGYGGPQSVFALEHALDVCAQAAGIDPIEIRRRNVKGSRESWGPKARPVDRTGFDECLRVGAAAMGWDDGVPPATGGPHTRRGRGVAVTSWKSGIAGKPGAVDHSGATVHLSGDGRVDLRTAASDLGTGIRTTLAQICAEVMGVDVADVRVSAADTATTPFDSGAHASRSLYRCGQAVHQAAAVARSRVLDFAGSLLEADPADLTIVAREVRVVGARERSLSLEAVTRRALAAGIDIHGEGATEVENALTWAAHFADVEVDTETGVVRLLRLVATQDVGRAVNPTIVEGQVQGGASQGIGYALSEALEIDDSGSLSNGTFMDYRLPAAPDAPCAEVHLVEIPDESGPFGAKGVGEPSIMLPAPAIANAVLDAVGVSLADLPMTPERVVASLAAGRPLAFQAGGGR